MGGQGEVEEGERGMMEMTWGGEHPIHHHTDDVLWNCTPETYAILLTNGTRYVIAYLLCHSLMLWPPFPSPYLFALPELTSPDSESL